MPQGVTIDFNANIARFSRSIDRATKKLNGFRKGAQRNASGLQNIFSKFGGKIAFGAAATGLATVAKQSLEAADNIAEVASKVGLTTDALQELRYAAEISGVRTSALDMAMQRFSRRIGEAVRGTGELKESLKQYNIQLQDSEGNLRPLENILNDYANAIQGAGNAQEQLRLAFKGFDSEGAALVNVLKHGKEGLDALRESARDAGAVMDAELIKKAEAINNKWEALTQTIGVKFKSAIISVIDFLSTGVDLSTTEKKIGQARNRIRELSESIEEYGVQLERLRGLGDAAPTEGIKAIEGIVRRAKEEIRALTAEIDKLQGKAVKVADIIDVKGIEELERFAQSLTEKFNPADKVARELEKIEEAFNKGLITPQVYAEAIFDAMSQIEEAVSGTRDEIEEFARSLNEANQVTDNLYKIEEAFERGLISSDTYFDSVIAQFDRMNDAIDETRDNVEEVDTTWRDVSTTLASGFEDAIVEGEKFRDVLKEIAKDLLRLFVRQQIVQPAAQAITAAFPGMASGGPVQAGRPYYVGERGVEMFVPRTSGNIVPNNQLGGGLTQHITINAAGADNATVERIKQVAAKMGRDMVYNELQRNGPIRSAI